VLNKADNFTLAFTFFYTYECVTNVKNVFLLFQFSVVFFLTHVGPSRTRLRLMRIPDSRLLSFLAERK
jgi:hypothetical protein